MRAAAERRADGVYVAAGVELIEPEYRHQSALAPGGDAEPGRTARRLIMAERLPGLFC
jgi:hypothetical protein